MPRFYRLKSIRSDLLYVLSQPEYTIGRVKSCDIFIESGLLSRQHAQLQVSAEGVTIQDLSSTNGTYVNSMRIHAPTQLRHGDVVTLGDEKLVLMAPEPPQNDLASERRLKEELAAYRHQDRTSGKTMFRSSYMQTGEWSSTAEDKAADEALLPVADRATIDTNKFDKQRTPAVLLVRSGRSVGRVVELRLPFGAEQQWSLGRSSLSDVVLDDPTVSSDHAYLRCERKQWNITDNGSTNGIKLNQISVKSARCKNGDIIAIGNVKLELRIID